MRIEAEKSPLTISHGSAQAMAQIEGINSDQDNNQVLRADVSVRGEGFNQVRLVIKRAIGNISIDETVGNLPQGMGTLIWKPSLRGVFNTVLLTQSFMDLYQFLDFLKTIGAEIHQNLPMRTYFNNDFLLNDGPTIDYSLQLIGEKHILGHEKDETKIMLEP